MSGRERRLDALERKIHRAGARPQEERDLRAMTDDELIAHVRALAAEVRDDSAVAAEGLVWADRLKEFGRRAARGVTPEPERQKAPGEGAADG